MRSVREHLVDRAVARVLSRAAGYVFGVEVIAASVELEVVPPPSRTEIADSLRWHDAAGHLVSVQGDTGPKYKLSEPGRAWQAENR